MCKVLVISHSHQHFGLAFWSHHHLTEKCDHLKLSQLDERQQGLPEAALWNRKTNISHITTTDQASVNLS